jgi:hypothetical protein
MFRLLRFLVARWYCDCRILSAEVLMEGQHRETESIYLHRQPGTLLY